MATVKRINSLCCLAVRFVRQADFFAKISDPV